MGPGIRRDARLRAFLRATESGGPPNVFGRFRVRPTVAMLCERKRLNRSKLDDPPPAERMRHDLRSPHLHAAHRRGARIHRALREAPAGAPQALAARRLLADRVRPPEPGHPCLSL